MALTCKRPSTVLWTLFALLALSGNGSALEPGAPLASYSHRQWTEAEGLPQNSVFDLLQTRDGYLWLATAEGLARFDGRRFTVFDNSNTPAIRNNLIRVLHEGGDGSFWIGTFGGGLVRLQDGEWTTYTTQDGLGSDDVRALDEDAEGTLWIATAQGLNALQRDGSLRAWTAEDGLPTVDLSAVRVARDGSVWVGTSSGLVRYRDGRFTTYTTREGLPHDDVLTIYQDGRGALWVGTSGGLGRFDAAGFVAFTIGEKRRHNVVYAIDRDSGGTLWVGTGGGALHRFQHDRFIPYPSAPGLFGDSIWDLLEDHEGNLWIGTQGGGLSRLSDRLISTITSADGLAHDTVWGIHEGRRGRIWIGTEGGLNRLERGGIRARTVDAPPPDGNAVVIHEDRAGRFWVGGRRGLKVREDGRWRTYGTRDGLVDERVRALLEDRAGRLWIGTWKGLSVFSDGAFTNFTSADGLPNDLINALYESRDGTLWVATVDGIATRHRGGRWTSIAPEQGLSHEHTLSFHEDADGTLWIGTHGGGLNRLRDGRFRAIRAKDGLCDDVVFTIFEDDFGNFWTSSNKGICRVSRKSLEAFANGEAQSVSSTSYGVADGMKSRECNGGAGWQSSDGRLWFGTIRGVAIVDPRRLNRAPPPVTVESVDLGKSWTPARSGLRVPPGSRDVKIRYTATSFLNPEKVRFRYRLEGWKRDWTDAGDLREVTYASLPPDEYVFHVMAANKDGVWNREGASFAFEILPRFHETLAFRVPAVIALLALAFGLHRARAWHLVRRLERLEETVQERTAEVVAEKDKVTQAHAELGVLNDEVSRAKAAVEQAHQDMLSLLYEMGLGVLILNRDEEAVFSSRVAQELLRTTAEEARGRRWYELLGLSDDDRASVAEQLGLPSHLRSRVPVALGRAGTRPHWVEIAAQDHPRDPERRILLLYDVAEVYDLRRLVDEKASFHGLVGQTGVMQLMFRAVRDLAPTDVAVLIEGETGTGKELVARAIHAASRRRREPFIAVNCAGLTESLLSSQLFGHRKGAFTGAVTDQVGFFEAADGGTLLLDEVGDLPPSVQSSLLRVLQENEIVRVGESTPRPVDVRLLAATHRDLTLEVAEGRFRQDLLYRIRIARIPVPALRDRRDDIPLLASWFLAQARTTKKRTVEAIGATAMKRLMEYAWPGNVRELKSAVESAAIACQGWVIQPEDLPPEILDMPAASDPGLPEGDERQRVLAALERANGNRTAAARLLGVSRATFYRRLRDLGIESS